MKYLVYILLFFYSVNFYSQSENSLSTYYKWFDSVLGVSNTGLLNGVEYKEKYRTVDGNNQYFLEYDFSPSQLVYSGQPYYDIPMKYDVNGDNLIIKLANNISGQFAIQLIKKNIGSFKIDDHLFVNSNHLNIPTSDKDGFFEALFQSKNISIYKKHIKNDEARKNSRFAYTKFVYRSKFLINYNNKLHVLNSKKNVVQLFPQHKKEINTFYSKNRPLMKSDYDKFLKKTIYVFIGLLVLYTVNALRIFGVLVLNKYASADVVEINHSYVFLFLVYSTLFILHFNYIKRILKQKNN